MRQKLSREAFVRRSVLVHGLKYDYSQTIYHNSDVKVRIFCPKHGIFEQRPHKHLSGQGCRLCSVELPSYNQDTTASFVDKAQRVHGDKYDYSLVVYRKSWLKVRVVCPKHGVFEQTPNNHTMGMGCLKCANEKSGEKRRSTREDFIRKARRAHGDKYDYSLVEYSGCGIKVKIVCPFHGPFLQKPCSHLNSRGCPSCHESRGERKIVVFLESYGIRFTRQKIFERCKNVRNLPFDFFLPEYNTCIEFDGKQHFFPVNYFGGSESFYQLKKLDSLKNEFCKDSGICLIRVSYRHGYSEIANILKKSLHLPDNPEKQVSFVPTCEVTWEKVHEYLLKNLVVTNRVVRDIIGVYNQSKVSRMLLRWVEFGRIKRVETKSRKASYYCLPLLC